MKDVTIAAYDGDACPYSEMSYIEVPIDSVIWRIGAGSAWHANGKRKVSTTAINQPSGALMCKKYMVSSGGLTTSGVWNTGNLRVVSMTDEDGKAMHTFTDGEGRIVLTRSDTKSKTFADTYYVYDDKGLLRFVLPPEASAKLAKNPGDSKDVIANLCYTYTYDDLNRCVSKKLPGCKPVQMRYDRDGRRWGFVQGKWRASTAKAVCWRAPFIMMSVAMWCSDMSKI